MNAPASNNMMRDIYGQFGSNQRNEQQRGEAAIRNAGGSPGAIANYSLNAQQQAMTSGRQLVTPILQQQSQERQQLQGQIDEAQLRRDMYQQQLDEEEKAKKQAWTRTLAQTGGQLLGAGAGFLLGGPIGAAAGSQIGGGVANAAVGLDKSYDSPELLAEGAGQIIGGISAGIQAGAQKRFTSQAQKYVPAVIKSGDPKAIESLMNALDMSMSLPGGGYDTMDWSLFDQYLPKQTVYGPY